MKIGTMREEIEEKLKTEIDKASWDMLIEHHTRGAVFIVAPNLSLVKVATAIAVDDSSLVAIWLKNKEFQKVTEIEKAGYEKNPKEKKFEFIIVQPYVLIREITSDKLS